MRTLAVSAGPLSISETSPAAADEWDTIYRACDYATFFHSRQWVEFWARLKPDTVLAMPMLVRFSDGKRAVLPFLQQTRAGGLLRTLASSIDATFGGWIARDRLEPEHAQLLMDYLFTGLPCALSWRINPYDPHAPQVLERLRSGATPILASQNKSAKLARSVLNWGKPLFIEDHTHALDLRPGFVALFKIQSAIVRKAKKASRSGVVIRVAERVEEWEEYYGAYRESIGRWGRNPSDCYPWELFRLIFEANASDIRLWIATYEGKIVSGAVCFYAKKHVVYFHGSSLAAYFELRPVNLLMLEIIRDACAEGYDWYDFNPSGFLPGVIAFKESFGAKPLLAPHVYVDDSVQRGKRALMFAVRGY